jgi:hypothetical protein
MGEEAVVSGVTLGAVDGATVPALKRFLKFDLAFGGRSISREIWEALGHWVVLLLANGLLI